MKEYCVDLEIAKKLKENGFPQTTEFYHRIQKDGIGEFTDFSDTNLKSDFMTIVDVYSAPCSDELIKELPGEIKDLDFDYYYHLNIERSSIYNEMYFISYGITKKNRAWMKYYCTEDKKFTKALSKMWLLLKKEGYIK